MLKHGDRVRAVVTGRIGTVAVADVYVSFIDWDKDDSPSIWIVNTALELIPVITEPVSLFAELTEQENHELFMTLGKACTNLSDVCMERIDTDRPTVRWQAITNDILGLRDELNQLIGC